MINVLQTAIDMPWGQVIVKSLSSQTLDVNDYIYCEGQQSIVQIQAKYEKYENHEQPAGYMPFTDNSGRTWWATRNELCKLIEDELKRKLPSVGGAITSMFKDCRFPLDEPENEAVNKAIPVPSSAAEEARIAMRNRKLSLNEWAALIKGWADEKGWWLGESRSNATLYQKIALMHTELSEAVEALRDPKHQTPFWIGEENKPEGWGIELIDCVIRILDTLAFFGLDPDLLMRMKHEYNESRSFRHGGKLA